MAEERGQTLNIGAVKSEDVVGPYSLLTLPERFAAHDLAGDGVLLFVAETFSPGTLGFRVFHQQSGKEFERLPAPARGFCTPFKFRLKSYQRLGEEGSKGILYGLDSAHPKSAGIVDNALILKYRYEYHEKTGFQSSLLETHRIPSNTVPLDEQRKGIPPNGAMFVTSFDFIDDGLIAMADCLAGVIWLFDMTTDALSLAFTHPNFLFKPWPEDLKVTLPDGRAECGYTGWTHNKRKELVPYVHVFPIAPNMPRLVPGLHGLTFYKKGSKKKIVFVSTARPGIYAIEADELMRTDIPAHQKKWETLVPPIRGVASWIGEVQADTFNDSSPWVFFHRTLSRSNEPATPGFETWRDKFNPLYRINMETKHVEFVGEDWKLWDIDSNLNVIPWKPGFTRLTSTPVQQYRLPETAGLINDPNDYSKLPEDFVFPVIDVKN